MSEPQGEQAPFVSIAYRRHHARAAGAFAAGLVVGAAGMYLVVLVAAALGRGVAG